MISGTGIALVTVTAHEAVKRLLYAETAVTVAGLPADAREREESVFAETAQWLALYFAGKRPDFCPPLAPRGSTFRQQVWALLRQIPYGETRSYGELAHALGCASPRALGQAVGRNPISLLIPCHRVLGADGGLTGYAGGLWRKEALLRLEGALPKEDGPWS